MYFIYVLLVVGDVFIVRTMDRQSVTPLDTLDTHGVADMSDAKLKGYSVFRCCVWGMNNALNIPYRVIPRFDSLTEELRTWLMSGKVNRVFRLSSH